MPIDLTATVLASVDLTDVVARYVNLSRKGSQTRGRCPFHAGQQTSFSIYAGTDGLQRYRCSYCLAGSEGGTVIDFIQNVAGVETSEACRILIEDALPPPGTKPPPPKKDETKAWEPMVPPPKDAGKYDSNLTFNPMRGRFVKFKPARIDPYLDAAGKILCYVALVEYPDGTVCRPTLTYCEGPEGAHVWCLKRMQPPYPLQGLDELKARPDDAVLVVSSEKLKAECAEIAPLFVTVTWLGGNSCAKLADIAPLKNRYVTYWPNADKSGCEAMDLMAKAAGHV